MRSLGRSLLNVAGLASVGLVPLLVVLGGLKVAAPDGTMVWEPPALPGITVTVGGKPARDAGRVIMLTPPAARPAATRRARHADV